MLVRMTQNHQGRESAKYDRCLVIGRVWDTEMKLGREDPDRRHQRESVGVSQVPVVYFQKAFIIQNHWQRYFTGEFHFGRSRLSGEMLVRDSGVLGIQGKIRNFISNWNCWIWMTPTTSSHTLLGPGNSPHRTCCGSNPDIGLGPATFWPSAKT